MNKLLHFLFFLSLLVTSKSVLAQVQPCNIDPTADHCDFDGDGVINSIDLDDDNDGVLDTLEGICFDSNSGSSIFGDLPGSQWGTGYGTIFFFNDLTNFTSVNNLFINPNLITLNPSNCNLSINGSAILDNINSTSLAQAKSTNEYLGMNFTTKNNIFNSSIDYFYFFRSVASNYNITFSISSDNINFTDLATTIYSTPTGSFPTHSQAVDLPNYPLLPNTTYYIRIYMYGLSSGTTAYIDDIGMAFDWCEDIFTDSDLIPNRLDLDSDNDGCSDAIEAGASTTATSTTVCPSGSDSNDNGLLNGYEDTTEGSINYTSTYHTYALVAGLNTCIDSDDDGVNDFSDLDDDNDGVLDTREGVCFNSTSGVSGQLPNGAWGSSSGLFFQFGSNATDDSSSTNNLVNPGSVTIIPSNCSLIVSGGNATINNVNSTTLAHAKSSNEYLGFNFTTKSNVFNASIEHFAYYRWFASTYTMTWAISSDNINFTDLITNTYSGAAGGFPNNTVALNISNYPLAPNTTYYIRIYMYNLSSGTTAYIDDIGVAFDWCDDRFTDSDLIPNRLDLDSDGDGCSDANESGIPTFKFDTSTGIITDVVGANGLANNLETATDNGIINYTATYSIAINPLANNCPCTQNPNTAPATSFTQVGISSQETKRAGWPDDLPNGFIVLESKNKGFVVTRLSTPQRNALIAIEGMLIYNTSTNIMELYNGTTWVSLTKSCNQ